VLSDRREFYSRRWDFWVNRVAASNLLSRGLRTRIYRRAGLRIDPPTWGIGAHCFFRSAEISFGQGSFVNDYCYFENAARITVGREVAFGPRVAVITSSHSLGAGHRRCGRWTPLPVEIGDGCWIGAQALILPGVRIGHGAVIAAGAVVNDDCEPDGLYGGTPARLLRRLEDGRQDTDSRRAV
jgi:maltose O-acetyltransferase